jgi:hypothetical protein
LFIDGSPDPKSLKVTITLGSFRVNSPNKMGNCHPTDSDFNENFKFWLDRADTFRDMAPRNLTFLAKTGVAANL